ncbi:MAG TPA: PTS sugar transporter subunit IIA [Ignavibacteriaceae bacterium]|nr:PTS sugar transporter subunit IIA [Ignavibacteriaceae bacterium]
MKVSDLLNTNLVISELNSTKKNDVLNELLDLFKDDPRVLDLEKVKTAVMDRELIMSTGVGKGFAIPHGKTSAVTEILGAFGKSSKSIEYDSLDGKPVNLIFLLVGKDTLVSSHIKLLSRISRLMNKDDFRERLTDASTTEEIIYLFKEEEKHFGDV